MKKMRKVLCLLLSLSMFLALAACGNETVNNKPTITGVKDLTVQAGTEIDVLAGVAASDAEDGDLTAMINEMISAGNAEAAYLNNAGAWLVAVVGVPNGIGECIVAAIIVPMIKTAVEAVLRRTRRSGRRKEETV